MKDASSQLQKQANELRDLNIKVEESNKLGNLKKQILDNKHKYIIGLAFVTFKTKRMTDMIEEAWGRSSPTHFST